MTPEEARHLERVRAIVRRRAKVRKRPVFVRPASNTNSEINVTPLIDVVLVLLIIFMVLTPLKEADIPVAVPESDKAEDVSEVPPDQLVVYLGPTGKTRVNTQEVPEDQLEAVLKQRLTPRAKADRVVFVVASDDVSYGKLVAVIDHAKQAGAETIGYATEAPDPAVFQ